MATKCTTCNGVYASTLPDGTRYFHGCAPVWNGVTQVFDERAQKRDENVTIVAGAVVMKAAGKGTTTV